MMLFLRNLVPLVFLLVCAPAWAQSGSASAPGSDSTTPTPQSPETPPTSDKRSSPDRTSAASPADSTELQPVKTQRAAYPYEAQKQQLQGQVMVRILVSETGDVESAEVVSGNPILGKSAVEAVKKWKFKPFIKNGKPVKVSTKLPFDFAFAGNIHDEKVLPADATALASGQAPQLVHVSHEVSVGLLLHKVQPVYPPEARRAHIQGTVVLRAVISQEGRIADLQPISGPKELTPAAIGAVQQWRYRPYLLAGNPVEIVTEITVNFQLRAIAH